VFDGRPEIGPTEQREASADAGGQKQLRGTPQEPAAMSQTKNAFEKVHRAIKFEQEPWMEP